MQEVEGSFLFDTWLRCTGCVCGDLFTFSENRKKTDKGFQFYNFKDFLQLLKQMQLTEYHIAVAIVWKTEYVIGQGWL